MLFPVAVQATSIKRRWLLTVVAFVAFGVALQLAIGVAITRYGTWRSAEQWLWNSYRRSSVGVFRQVRSRLAQLAAVHVAVDELDEIHEAGTREDLDAEIRENWPLRDEDDGWISIEAGLAHSSYPACDGRLARWLEEGFILCGRELSIAVEIPGDPSARRVFLTHRVSDRYARELRMQTGTEIAIWGAEGPIASTFKDLEGRPIYLSRDDLVEAFADPGDRTYFGKHTISLPDWAGYLEGQEPLQVGESDIEGYVLLGDFTGGGSAKGADVKLMLMVPVSFLATGFHAGLYVMGLASLLIVGILLSIAWSLVVRYTRPLRELTAAARRLGAGELGVRLPETGDLEVVELSRAFNAMAEDLRRSQAQSIQSEKMVAVGQLAAGLAHEINNPLAVILGFAQGVERRLGPEDPFRAPVGSIVREALRCRSLVEEMLAFSRIEPRRVERVDLNDVVHSSAMLLEAKARMQKVAVVEALEALPELPAANRNQLQQLLLNLGTNALDAMSGGGTLTLKTRSHAGGVELCVADTGEGIPEAIRPRIFEPFFTTKEIGKGTGLGLSLVYRIVEMHHATISVDSAVGAGTIFKIDFPIEARSNP